MRLAKSQISLGICPVWSESSLSAWRVLSYPLGALRRLWSDWVDAQADLSLGWTHNHFVGFGMRWLKYWLIFISVIVVWHGKLLVFWLATLFYTKASAEPQNSVIFGVSRTKYLSLTITMLWFVIRISYKPCMFWFHLGRWSASVDIMNLQLTLYSCP